MTTLPGADGPVLDPQLDDLAFPVLLRQWAAAKGVTTLRQLATVPPAELIQEPDRSAILVGVRAILERYLGRTWEELASGEASPGTVRPVEPRLPSSWDELRLVLPAALRASLLDDIDLPPQMQTHVARRGFTTLGELARQSETLLLAEGRVGRITVRRTFRAVVAFARLEGTPVVMLPAVALGAEGFAPARAGANDVPARGLLDEWKALVHALPPDPRRAMRLRAGLDGSRPETYGAIGALMGIPPARARRIDGLAVALLTQEHAWMAAARARFTAALRGPTVPLATLAADPWWAGIAAVPDALDYFGERLLDGEACVLELDGVPYLARCVKPGGPR
jgi:hypothetical protein